MPRLLTLVALLVAAALMLAAGCASNQAPVGQNPARLALSVTARVTADQVAEVWRRKPPQEPLWDLALYLKGDDGRLLPLALAPGSKAKALPGLTVKAQPSFLLPPGSHRLQLIATAYIHDIYYDGMRGSTEWPEVRIFKRELTAALAPGQTSTMSVTVGP